MDSDRNSTTSIFSKLSLFYRIKCRIFDYQCINKFLTKSHFEELGGVWEPEGGGGHKGV